MGVCGSLNRPAGSRAGRPPCPDLDTSSATSLDSLRYERNRGSEQDFASSAPMSESQSKRVASSFLNDNDFFHVNEVDIESTVRAMSARAPSTFHVSLIQPAGVVSICFECSFARASMLPGHPLLEAVLQNRPRVVKALLLLGSRRLDQQTLRYQ